MDEGGKVERWKVRNAMHAMHAILQYAMHDHAMLVTRLVRVCDGATAVNVRTFHQHVAVVVL